MMQNISFSSYGENGTNVSVEFVHDEVSKEDTIEHLVNEFGNFLSAMSYPNTLIKKYIVYYGEFEQ